MTSCAPIDRTSSIFEVLQTPADMTDEVIERLEAVTVEDILRVAQRCARPDQARLAVLGPFRSRLRFERLLAAAA